ncbi:hypothetical protein FOG51_03914 [Hanseniaspora uvarum]|nr:hypothetical protein FOG51_03914 [Hanseniaspora uvarum]
MSSNSKAYNLDFSQDFKVFIDTSFFSELRDYKIHHQKLNSDIINLPGSNINIAKRTITLSNKSFDKTPTVFGNLLNFNTIEEFKRLDKVKYIKEGVFDNNTKFNFFNVISFADLKKYVLVYWVNIPVLKVKNLKFELEYLDSFDEHVPEEYHSNNFIYIKNGSIFINNDLIAQNGETILVPNLIKTYLINEILDLTKTSEYLLYAVSKESVTNCYRIVSKLNDKVFDAAPFTKEDVLVSGWEKNGENKLIPKIINFSTLLDPIELNKQNVSLNLQLMKWRIKPDLKLEHISQQKVLIIGAGTLGCYVSRCLLGWGIYNITFIDNGTISHSNPVRQSLYGFDDIGKSKAQAASENLKKIYPLCNSNYINMKIPMVGHVDSIDEENYKTLQTEIKKCDVVFLLMDSRESRWLPTLVAKAENKIVINAAIGFDSYVVMKHGDLNEDDYLGCYYCSDIVAPLDSMSNQTLDQMCTVTRPGCAMLASATAVELFVTYIQDGKLPHNQIRANLNGFSSTSNSVAAYKFCSACSKNVVEAYKADDWSFAEKALKNSKYLEDMCGITQENLKAQQLLEEMEHLLI